jgi:hypothetical protein
MGTLSAHSQVMVEHQSAHGYVKLSLFPPIKEYFILTYPTKPTNAPETTENF